MWKTIPFFTRYEASDSGQIRRKDTKEFLKFKYSYNKPDSYYRVYVIPDNKALCSTQFVHRLICLAFDNISLKSSWLKLRLLTTKMVTNKTTELITWNGLNEVIITYTL